jgi:hypothetical protein
LTDGNYKCPRCGNMSLRFEDTGLCWDQIAAQSAAPSAAAVQTDVGASSPADSGQVQAGNSRGLTTGLTRRERSGLQWPSPQPNTSLMPRKPAGTCDRSGELGLHWSLPGPPPCPTIRVSLPAFAG